MRVLALDHGSARCGVAVCDPTGTIVTPLDVVKKPDSKVGREQLAALVAEREIELVLIGLPRLQSGEEGAQAATVRAFAGRLAALIDAPVEFHDERFTTRMAESSRADGATSAEDSLAAAHLLEDYLEMNRREDDDTR
ncbi:MAG: Holliday junction resolvase RuvX [Solirubrobacterales bacterium]